METRFTVRTAVSADEKRIRALFEEMLRSICHTDAVEGYEAGYLDKFWTGGEDRIYVAEAGEVVAYLSVEIYRRPEAYAYFDDCSVTAAWRSRGIGSSLLRTAEDYVRALKLPVIIFHVAKTNVSARRLYERLGFSVLRDDGDRFLMGKKLV